MNYPSTNATTVIIHIDPELSSTPETDAHLPVGVTPLRQE